MDNLVSSEKVQESSEVTRTPAKSLNELAHWFGINMVAKQVERVTEAVRVAEVKVKELEELGKLKTYLMSTPSGSFNQDPEMQALFTKIKASGFTYNLDAWTTTQQQQQIALQIDIHTSSVEKDIKWGHNRINQIMQTLTSGMQLVSKLVNDTHGTLLRILRAINRGG